MVGIENLNKVVKTVVLLGNAIDKSTKDGLSFEDAGNFIPALMEMPGAFQNIDVVGDEIKDLDAAEIVQLKELVAQELVLIDKDLEAVIELSLKTIIDIYNLYQEIKALKDA